jgi:cell wall-associated NlpC family hydrolase
MKKFSRYILIIILLESFVWTTQVNAQTGSVILPNNVNSTTQTVSDQRGTCVSNGQTFTNWTRDACVKNSNNAVWTGYYYFLQPLPGVGVNDNSGSTTNGVMFDPTNKGSQSTSLGSYLNPMITAFIGICAILAFVMIVIGGIEYMTSELPGNKSDGKDRITNAIFGLLLALGAWTILNTINPNLLNSDISTPNANVTATLGGESTAPFVPASSATVQSAGFNCPGSGGKGSMVAIAQSFVGKTNYTQDNSARNTFSGSTYNGDCSSFVDQVSTCAGLENPGGNTATIFQNQNSHDINGKTFDYTTLHPGDLVGWPPENDPNGNGHVMIYIGNGQVIDNQPSGTQVRQISNYASRITSVTWSN